MKIKHLSNKQRAYIELCKRVALQSDHPFQKHGAALVKGGKVINTSFNRNQFNKFAQRFWYKDNGHGTIHAEIGAILNVDRSITEGATIYVVRIGRADGIMKNSKPCDMCAAVMKFAGIKRVIYSYKDGVFCQNKI
jgi:tRNA(Arg) A34 adenosine deaminase TadA